RRRQRRTRHVDIGTAQGFGRVAVFHARQGHHHAFVGFTTARTFNLALGAGRCTQRPRQVAEDRLRRLGEGLQFQFATHAEHAVDPAYQDAARRIVHAESDGGAKAPPLNQAAAAAAALAASLYRLRTLSVSCAPLDTQWSTRATSSTTRCSLPCATGL